MKRYAFPGIVVLFVVSFLFLWAGAKDVEADDEDLVVPASRVKDAMKEMDCKNVSPIPDVWTCEHARAFCIVLNPSNQAQLQCQFR
jgi:hypothetical protein